jgi:hypothetical protein
MGSLIAPYKKSQAWEVTKALDDKVERLNTAAQ